MEVTSTTSFSVVNTAFDLDVVDCNQDSATHLDTVNYNLNCDVSADDDPKNYWVQLHNMQEPQAEGVDYSASIWPTLGSMSVTTTISLQISSIHKRLKGFWPSMV